MGPQISHLSIINSPANVIDNGYAIMVTWARIPKVCSPHRSETLWEYGPKSPVQQYLNHWRVTGLNPSSDREIWCRVSWQPKGP